MAGDIGIREQIYILPRTSGSSTLASAGPLGIGRVMHRYGERVLLAEVSSAAEAASSSEGLVPGASQSAAEAPDDLTETERYGVNAFMLRQSPEYLNGKANRPHDGVSWEGPEGVQPLSCADVGAPGFSAALALGAGSQPLSARLNGKVAVGIVIVDGPTNDLKFSSDEKTKVVAEVQNGLGWLGAQNAAAAVTWYYDVKSVAIIETPLPGTPSAEDQENRMRDPAMAKLGYGAGMDNVVKYANDLRTKLGTDWAYIGFFVKYPLYHFAYASIGGPRLIMQYSNDGWGPDNIDRVFTHESGHIFGCPDEYKTACNDCGGSWGYYGKPNINCETCATNGGVSCLMRGNDWAMCSMTPYHFGFPLADQRYSGVFRSGAGKYGLWVNASAQSFIAKWQEWNAQGLRLVDLDIVQVGEDRRYSGVWVPGTDAYGLWLNADWNAFVAKWTEWSKAGLRLVSLEATQAGSQTLYSGVFRGGTDAYGLWGNASYDAFIAKWTEWSKANLRLVDLKIVTVGGDRRYSGVFRGGTDAYGLWLNANWDAFVAKWTEWSKANLRLTDLEVNNVGNQRLYSGVFRAGTDAYGLWGNADFPSFKAKCDEWSGKGLRLIDVEVTDPGDTANAPQKGSAAMTSDSSTEQSDASGSGAFFGVGTSLQGGDIDTGAMFPASSAPEAKVNAASANGGSGGMWAGSAFIADATASESSKSQSGQDGFGDLAGSTQTDGSGGLGPSSSDPALLDLNVGERSGMV